VVGVKRSEAIRDSLRGDGVRAGAPPTIWEFIESVREVAEAEASKLP